MVNTKNKTVDVYLLKDGKFVLDNVYEKLGKDDIELIEKYGT